VTDRIGWVPFKRRVPQPHRLPPAPRTWASQGGAEGASGPTRALGWRVGGTESWGEMDEAEAPHLGAHQW
jgi:hypothetical protein